MTGRGLSSMGCKNSDDSSKSYFSVVKWVEDEACRWILAPGLMGGGGGAGGPCIVLLGSGSEPSGE